MGSVELGEEEEEDEDDEEKMWRGTERVFCVVFGKEKMERSEGGKKKECVEERWGTGGSRKVRGMDLIGLL